MYTVLAATCAECTYIDEVVHCYVIRNTAQGRDAGPLFLLIWALISGSFYGHDADVMNRKIRIV